MPALIGLRPSDLHLRFTFERSCRFRAELLQSLQQESRKQGSVLNATKVTGVLDSGHIGTSWESMAPSTMEYAKNLGAARACFKTMGCEPFIPK